jgi:hypothetical protein
MASYRYSLTFNDPFAGVSTRSYSLVAITFTAARLIADTVLAAVQGWTDLAVVKEELVESDAIVAVAGANSNVDRGATMQFDTGGGTTASINFPSPLVSTINPDRSVDLANGLVAAWTAPYLAGDITVSDGELVLAVIKGTLDR